MKHDVRFHIFTEDMKMKTFRIAIDDRDSGRCILDVSIPFSPKDDICSILRDYAKNNAMCFVDRGAPFMDEETFMDASILEEENRISLMMISVREMEERYDSRVAEAENDRAEFRRQVERLKIAPHDKNAAGA